MAKTKTKKDYRNIIAIIVGTVIGVLISIIAFEIMSHPLGFAIDYSFYVLILSIPVGGLIALITTYLVAKKDKLHLGIFSGILVVVTWFIIFLINVLFSNI